MERVHVPSAGKVLHVQRKKISGKLRQKTKVVIIHPLFLSESTPESPTDDYPCANPQQRTPV